jgi:hypothetical protein
MAEKTGVTAETWLFLLREGGRWTAQAVRAQVSPHSIDMPSILQSLAKTGFVIKHPKERIGAPVTFSVTLDCKVPLRVTLKDILANDAKALVQESQ